MPGWQAHPEHPTIERYWDGHQWTEHRFAANTDGPVTESLAARPADPAEPGWIRQYYRDVRRYGEDAAHRRAAKRMWRTLGEKGR